VKHIYGCSEEAVLELEFPESWTRARAEHEARELAGRDAGKVAVAQAEYFFSHDGQQHSAPQEWLWNMAWRARLVRFRLPEPGQQRPPSLQDPAVASLAAGTASINTDVTTLELPAGAPRLESIEQLVVH
jgi:hypothetical protein